MMPPFADLFFMWKEERKEARLGQWFVDKHAPELAGSVLYFEARSDVAFMMIYNKFYHNKGESQEASKL